MPSKLPGCPYVCGSEDARLRNRSISGKHPLLSRELEFESMLGSQTFWFELSLPVIQRQIAPCLHKPPDLAAVGDGLSVSAARLLRNTPLQTPGYGPRRPGCLRFALLTSPLVHGSPIKARSKSVSFREPTYVRFPSRRDTEERPTVAQGPAVRSKRQDTGPDGRSNRH
jgi:hypothetical protein